MKPYVPMMLTQHGRNVDEHVDPIEEYINNITVTNNTLRRQWLCYLRNPKFRPEAGLDTTLYVVVPHPKQNDNIVISRQD